MVPVINSTDEYLRSNAVIAVSIVPSALGVPKLLPFLKPVCKSKDLWWPRHRGCPNSWGDCYFNGKVLAAFLIVFGSLIPLMDAVYAIHFAREVMGVLVREFDLPDEQEKQIVLNTVKQFVSVEGMKADYNGFLPEMFKKFLSLDKHS